jgi:hypothetical protein
MPIDKREFDTLVDENTAYMIQELVHGEKWRTIVFVIMDRTLMWHKAQDAVNHASK